MKKPNSITPLRMALSALGALLWTTSSSAIGLGDIEIYSALNAPFDADIEIIGAMGEQLDVEIITSAQHGTAAVRNAFAATEIKIGRSEAGNPMITLTGIDPLDEPFLHFGVSVKSEADDRRLREYAILLDAPGQAKARPAPIPEDPAMESENAAEAPSQTNENISQDSIAKEPQEYEPVDLNQIYYEPVDLNVLSQVYIDEQAAKAKKASAPRPDPRLIPEPFPINGMENEIVVVPSHITSK